MQVGVAQEVTGQSENTGCAKYSSSSKSETTGEFTLLLLLGNNLLKQDFQGHSEECEGDAYGFKAWQAISKTKKAKQSTCPTNAITVRYKQMY